MDLFPRPFEYPGNSKAAVFKGRFAGGTGPVSSGRMVSGRVGRIAPGAAENIHKPVLSLGIDHRMNPFSPSQAPPAEGTFRCLFPLGKKAVKLRFIIFPVLFTDC